MELFDEGMAQT